MSASKIHRAETFRHVCLKICSIASAVQRSFLNPYEFGSLTDSNTGSRASRYNACMALSRMVGIPSGRSFPFDFGM